MRTTSQTNPVGAFGIEIGAAFGPLQGIVWRIGTMGYSSQPKNVLLLLAALEAVLREEGLEIKAGAGVSAAMGYYKDRNEFALADVSDNLAGAL